MQRKFFLFFLCFLFFAPAVFAAETVDRPPIANFVIRVPSPTGYRISDTALVLDNILFDASLSRDQDCYGFCPLTYRWEFGGEGADQFYPQSKALHHFDEFGNYLVRLTVRDISGNEAMFEKVIHIVRNSAPTPSFTAEPIFGRRNLEFQFDATATTDDQEQSHELRYRWDFQGDDDFETNFEQRHRITKFRFPGNGTFTVSLEARDRHGAVGRLEREIIVSENRPPQAHLRITPSVGTYSTRFSLNASSSEDSDNDPLTFAWDFDYNGPSDIRYTLGFSALSIVSRFFQPTEDPLRLPIHLAVRDPDGAQDDIETTIAFHWSSPYLETLRRKNIIRPTSETLDFEPDVMLSRLDVVTMLIKARNIRLPSRRFQQRFSDVTVQHPSWRSIHAAAERGIINGYPDGTFRPTAPVSRAEALKMILQTFETSILRHPDISFSDVPHDAWFFPYLQQAVALELIRGYPDGTFRPQARVTLGEFAKILALMLG